ncbi:MAG: 4Fe-4S dicluster domain-containing protein [Promethearchaeota archaeon]
MDGKMIRMAKICGEDGKAMLIAADHGLMLGAIPGVINLEETLKRIIKGGVDGILLSPGQASRIGHLFHGKNSPALLIRGDYTSGFRSLTYTLPNQEIHQFKIIHPKKAIALGADAMVVYYLLGRKEDPLNDEATNIKIISKMAEESDKYGLPFFIEPMPFGPRVTGTNYVDLLKIGIKVAEEIGADAIKIPYSGDIYSFKQIVDSVDIPIFILGGAKSKSYREACEMVEDALRAGANGTVFGRQILQASDPEKLASFLMKIIHENISAKELFAKSIKGPSRLEINLDRCTGCNICSIVCSMSHSNMHTSDFFVIEVKKEFPKKLRRFICNQCGKCIESCPNKAILIDKKDSHLYIDSTRCDLCGNNMDRLRCVETCPSKAIKPPLNTYIPSQNIEIKSISSKYPIDLPLICDFCGGIPECIEWCPNDAIEIKESKFNVKK